VDAELQIATVLDRYFDCIEHREYEGLREVFTPDATAAWGTAGELPLDGADAIVAHLAASTGSISVTFTARRPVVAIEGATADARSRTVAYIASGGSDLLIAGAEYLDKLRLDAGGWHIYRRVHREMWRASAPLTLRDGKPLPPPRT
jgi:hypothetical protein